MNLALTRIDCLLQEELSMGPHFPARPYRQYATPSVMLSRLCGR